jgi:hypothetical protein
MVLFKLFYISLFFDYRNETSFSKLRISLQENQRLFMQAKNNAYLISPSICRDPKSESSQIRRKILEFLEKEGITKRSEIRDKIDVPAEKGKTHKIFDEMDKEGLITQNEVKIWTSPGKTPLEVQITELGKIHLKWMKDYGVGLK